jgi:hypothetical protein
MPFAWERLTPARRGARLADFGGGVMTNSRRLSALFGSFLLAVSLRAQGQTASGDPADASLGIDSTSLVGTPLTTLNPLTTTLACVQRTAQVNSVGIATAADQYVGWIDTSTATYPTYRLRDKNLRTSTIVNVETGMYESNLDMHGDQLVVETVNSLSAPTLGNIVGIWRTGHPPIIQPYSQTVEQTQILVAHRPRVFDTSWTSAGTEAFIWDDTRNAPQGNLSDVFERVNSMAENDVYLGIGDQLRPTTWYDGATQMMAWESRTYEGGENGRICVSFERHTCYQVTSLPLNWTPDGTHDPNSSSCERVTYTSRQFATAPYEVHVTDVQRQTPSQFCTGTTYNDRAIDLANAIDPRINDAGTFIVYGRITGPGTFDLVLADVSGVNPTFTVLKSGICGTPDPSTRLWAMDRSNGRAAVYFDSCASDPCRAAGIVKVTW